MASLIALLMVSFGLVGYAANFLLPVVGGTIAGVVLSILSHFVSRKMYLAYGISLGVVGPVLVWLITGIIVWLAPTVSQQTKPLAQTLPNRLTG